MFRSFFFYIGLAYSLGIQAAQIDEQRPKLGDQILMPDTRQQLIVEARLKTQSFAKQLKKTLKNSIMKDGLEKAIDTCQLQAPLIAQQHSLFDWKVRRTSLRVRNPDNTADSWEHKTLQKFEQRRITGESTNTLETLELVDGQLRYMEAIPTQQLCTACHGNAITPTISSALQQRYPDDQAIGYQVDQLRGAFSLILSLNPQTLSRK